MEVSLEYRKRENLICLLVGFLFLSAEEKFEVETFKIARNAVDDN